jgi:rhodanese-related sulfurtransferase
MNDAPQIVDLDREAIKQGLREGSMLLVDVREPHEFAAGHIPGAVSHPLSSFDPSSLPEGKRIVFSCAAGVRSVRALEFAQAAGRSDLREHYKGGFKDWASAGEPVE